MRRQKLQTELNVILCSTNLLKNDVELYFNIYKFWFPEYFFHLPAFVENT